MIKIKETDNILFSELKKSWTTFYGTYIDFWEHEYNKHGFCMVEEYNWNGYEEYFKFLAKFELLFILILYNIRLKY